MTDKRYLLRAKVVQNFDLAKRTQKNFAFFGAGIASLLGKVEKDFPSALEGKILLLTRDAKVPDPSAPFV